MNDFFDWLDKKMQSSSYRSRWLGMAISLSILLVVMFAVIGAVVLILMAIFAAFEAVPFWLASTLLSVMVVIAASAIMALNS